MNKRKGILGKILGTFAALAMTVGIAGTSSLSVKAEDEPSAANHTGTLTINPPTNASASDTGTRTYKVYKVFDAASTSATSGTTTTENARYTLISTDITVTGGKISAKTDVPNVQAQYGSESYDATTCPHFILDSAGNIHYGIETGDSETLTVPDTTSTTSSTKNINFTPSTSLDSYTIAAIYEYVKNDTPIAMPTATGNSSTSVENLDDGYYYITTTTGTAVTITTNTPNATVDDKNVVPTLRKYITAVSDGSVNNGVESNKAIAQLGSTVTYKIRVDFGNGSKNIKVHDTKGTGLSKNSNSTLSVTFYKNPGQNESNPQIVNPTGTDEKWWTYREQAYKDLTSLPTGASPNAEVGAPDGNDTMTLTFIDGINTHADYAEISYTLVVTSDTLQQGSPAENTAYVSYGGDPNDSNSAIKTPEQHTYVYNGKYTVEKTNGSGSALPDAEFMLTRIRNVGGSNTTQYYKYTAATDENPATVAWVDNKSEGTVLKSLATGNKSQDGLVDGNKLNFVGLPDGTYTIKETNPPRGYNAAADITFTINSADTRQAGNNQPDETVFTNTNLVHTSQVKNVQGSLLPSTGGIGTTIFYVAGVALIACAVILAAKKKKAA